jgi:iron complex outermembrane receptor protein
MLFWGYVAVFLFAPFCWAEDPTKDEPSITTMEEVVVTATKTKEKRKDIPNSVITKDAIDIQESSATGMGDLLANELGVDWRTYGDYGGASQALNIRGFGSDGTQVFINGININSASLGTADVGAISLNAIERIEVVKGSGSVLYGTGAMGGTVSIITKRPKRNQTDFRAGAGFGTQNTYRLGVEQGMFVFDDFGYYLTANRHETDGFRDNGDLTHNDISLNLVFDKGDALDISLYGDYIDREFGMPGVKPPSGTQDFVVNGVKIYNSDSADLLDRHENKDGHLVLRLQSNPSEWLGLKLQGDYTNMESYDYNRFYDGEGLPGIKTWVTNEVSTIEGNVDIKPIKGTNLLLGAQYKDYDWENETVNLDNNGNDVIGSESATNAGLYTKSVFVEAQYRPSIYFKALAGLRHENHSMYGDENVPRFGAVVNPHDTTVLKLSHGKHFKAPTPNDLFWPFEDWGFGMGIEGNPELKPETGWHSDVTLEQILVDNKMFVTLSYFKWDLKDKIRWVPDASFFYRPENLDTYEADGLEIGTKIGPFYNTILALNYTYIDAIEQRSGGVDRRALYSPDNLFKANLVYYTGFGLTATATVRYTSDRPARYDADTDTEASKTLASYWTTDIKLEQRIFDHWLISLQGNNIFDEKYDTYASTFRNNDTGLTTLEGYPGTGLSIFLSAVYEYR